MFATGVGETVLITQRTFLFRADARTIVRMSLRKRKREKVKLSLGKKRRTTGNRES